MLSHAVNHWDLAVAVHGQNFPHIHVHQEDITEVTAADFGLSQIDMLWASPSCVHHSRARGGKPKDDQQRSHADEVVDRWLRVANVDVLLVENVPEFAEWGPLHTTHSAECLAATRPANKRRYDAACQDKKVAKHACAKGCHYGQPIKERKGEFFNRFTAKLTAIGYRWEWRILCAADFGDPTTRRRFFMQAVRDKRPIVWPEPTHRDPRKAAGLFDDGLKPWRTAAECIDWSIPCPSIFTRKKPLAEATMRRIAAGVMRYVLQGKPYLLNLSHGGRLEPLDEPMRTVTAGPKGGDRALVAAHLTSYYGAKSVKDGRGAALNTPVPTQPTANRHGLVAASMVSLRGTAPDQIQASAGSVEAPLPTISAGGGHAALCAAFLAKHFTGVVGSSVEAPMPTVTGTDHNAVVATAMVRTDMHKSNSGCVYPMEDPLRTVTSSGGHALMAATMVQTGFGEREGQAPRCLDLQAPLGTVVAQGVKHGLVAATLITNTTGHAPTDMGEQPMPALTTGNHQALVAAFIQHYYGTGGQHQDPGQPLHTITTLARHGLVTVEIDGETFVVVDIGMRMLEPHELSKAMGFPEDFRFVNGAGKALTKRDTVKMIGNACPVGTVAALIKAVVLQRPDAFGVNEVVHASA